MLELFLFGIGFVLLFEGLVYFFFAKKIKSMFEMIKDIKAEKIRNFSTILIILGLCLIYFTLKFYKT
ncbi:MAG: DUF2065 family protein [Alphaproteobacteria bacterium]|tara:strand:+ start:216 stop:416 length:201 start_codon:yes stop_codon:yes gene_type:complete